MISLFDYLGRAAGSELGKKVNDYSQIRGAQVSQRYVENPVYKGKIMLYTREFLDEFFRVQEMFK